MWNLRNEDTNLRFALLLLHTLNQKEKGEGGFKKEVRNSTLSIFHNLIKAYLDNHKKIPELKLWEGVHGIFTKSL